MTLRNRPKSFYAEDAGAQCALIGEDLRQGPYTKAMESASKIVNQAVRDNFTSSASPDGSNWPERKHAGDGHPLLIESGALLQAAVDQGSGHIERFEPFGLVKGVQGETVPYAATQNYGRDWGRGAPIPAREFMGIDERGADAVAELLGDFVMTEIFG